MKMLREIIERFGVWCHQYDTQLLLANFFQGDGGILSGGNRCSDEGQQFETEYRKGRSIREILDWHHLPTLNGVALTLQEQVHSLHLHILGVFLDSQFSLKRQVAAVARSTFA